MSTETRERRRPLPELEAEQEVDLGRYASALAARPWLPLVGLLAGIVVGYLVSLGGGQVYRAEAVLYLGQPFSPNGGAPVQGLATNPRTVGEIIRSESALKEAARRSGLRVGKLRGRVATATITGTVPRAGQTPLVEISVQSDQPRRTAAAANALAAIVISRVAGYVDVKIDAYERQLETVNDAIESIGRRVTTLDRAIRQQGLSPLDELVLISQIDNAEQRRVGLINQQTQTQQLLALAENVERPRVVERAVPVSTTARSRRNSILVAGAIGLLLGLIAALAWDAFAARIPHHDRT
jgi:uncharacterized protein involved in exopolysaccharide biosynthesis